jgi:hypothetical protein
MKKKSKPEPVYRIPVRLSDTAKSRINEYRKFMTDKYHATPSINSAINTLIELGWPIMVENAEIRVAQQQGRQEAT